MESAEAHAREARHSGLCAKEAVQGATENPDCRNR